MHYVDLKTRKKMKADPLRSINVKKKKNHIEYGQMAKPSWMYPENLRLLLEK